MDVVTWNTLLFGRRRWWDTSSKPITTTTATTVTTATTTSTVRLAVDDDADASTATWLSLLSPSVCSTACAELELDEPPIGTPASGLEPAAVSLWMCDPSET